MLESEGFVWLRERGLGMEEEEREEVSRVRMETVEDGRWYWQCRLWWPQHLTAAHPDRAMALVGWASLSSASSLDLVIAAACPVPSLGSLQGLEGVLKRSGERLQNQLPQTPALVALPSVVGQYLPQCTCETKLHTQDNDNDNNYMKYRCNSSKSSYNKHDINSYQNWDDSNRLGVNGLTGINTRCTCAEMKGLTRGTSIWASATVMSSQQGRCIPRLSYVAVDGILHNANTHVILYQQPQVGRCHLSSRTWSSAFLTKQDCSRGSLKPYWVADLEMQQQSTIDIDRVVEQLNCGDLLASTVSLYTGTSCMKKSSTSKLWWQPVAVVVASIATMLYVLACVGSRLLDKWLPAVPGMRHLQNMSHTWHALQFRCHQLLSWPFILLWGGIGPEQANVGMAHRCRQTRNATWTATVVDMAMGAVAGVLVVQHQSSIGHFVQRMVRILTNDILRTGCVWLMGVPAGFKLNDELAARLGTLALHVIQTWATVGVLVRPALWICLPGLGLLAMLLGVTVPVAILVDMLLLGTIHVAILHQVTASLYANQLRALAALWCLFRGSKRNPLRGRQDTYYCSVEQLVVGSLMFTPLLLLLPTTSIFYTFFTLIYSVLSIIRLCLQYLILILQSFPYSQVALWVFQPQRFPSGIWFQVVCMDHDVQAPITLVSRLGVETASLGELLAPFAERLKGVCPLSSAVTLVYKLVSGGRIPVALELEKGEKLPYTLVSIPMFWRLCYEAVIMSPHDQ